MATDTFDCGTNYLEPTGFRVVINRQTVPNLQFYAQAIQTPDVSINPTEVSYPRVGRVGFVPESLEYGILSMDVLLDENMQSYREMYNWAERSVQAQHRLNYNSADDRLEDHFYADIDVHILTSHNNKNRSFKFRNAFPTTVGSIPLSAVSSGEYITFQTTFRFDYFDFI